MEEVVKYLKALLVLQIATYEAGDSPGKTEVLLARAGMSYTEIAELTGKTYAGVAKTLNRAKRGGDK